MPLFQKSVLKKHLGSLDKTAVESAWLRFSTHFLDVAKQENIRNSKEEQYQEGFLRELFVDVLGYVLNPSPGFNLTAELKNVGNAKKADGGIVQGEKVLGIIELKGTETVNLDKVQDQAFGYKSNQQGCRYVIVSNFEKLRLYVDDATDHEEFDLFELTPERFRLLYLLLAADYLFAEMPARIKQESALQEEDITRKFYKDYSAFKNALFDDLGNRNKEHDPLLLFKKSQKLLDRLLFIFFGEDKGLLPPNLVKKTVEDWDRLRELDEPRPLYDLFKRYFKYINEGTDRKDLNIFAYNGGLFEADEVLDNLKITDFVLYKYTQELTNYDFESEVDVNILGHIFEHSLNEIEEISAQLEGTAFDKAQTKRKKDGVFYTPRYITQYIVENTVGRLCTEKKAEIGIVEEEYAQERKGRRKDVMKTLAERLDQYQQWLFGLKICDPACGSGAFLNEAFDFLIKEHGYVAELRKHLFGESIAFSVENRILESNIYGVDINEEAVEIARLALWLRSAEPGRKLTHLSGHIKVGNSLIDDPAVAGDKAFNWQREFPEVFPQKELQAFHVVLTTHNSRTSQRMIQYRVEKGPALWLTPEHELLITRLIGEVIKDYGFRCMEYMVCADHVHLILVCEPEELTDVVRTIKSISARKFNLATGRTTPTTHGLPPPGLDTPREVDVPTGLDTPRGLAPLSEGDSGIMTRGQAPLEEEGPDQKKTEKSPSMPVWSQKFYRAYLDVWELATVPTKPGYWYESTHLDNAENYIRTNRQKHGLPDVPGLDALIRSFTCSQDIAFAPQYKGGFDVVVGNPPYVQSHSMSDFEKNYFYGNFSTAEYQLNLYGLFVERTFQLLKSDGLYSLIIPNYWLSTKFDKQLRVLLFIKNHCFELLNTFNIFEDATVDTLVVNGKKTPSQTFPKTTILKSISSNLSSINERLLNIGTRNWAFDSHVEFIDETTSTEVSFRTKLELGGENTLGDFLVFKKGMQPYEEGKGTPSQTREMMNEKVYHSNSKLDDSYLPLIGSKNVKRYLWTWDGEYIKYGQNLAAPRDTNIFKGQRILLNRILSKEKMDAVFIDEDVINNTDVFNLLLKRDAKYRIKVLLAIISSKLCADYFKAKNINLNRNAFPKINVNTLESFPVPEIDEVVQNRLEGFVKNTQSNRKLLFELTTQFTRLLRRRFDVAQLPQKLGGWHELDYKEFCAELNKLLQKVHKRKLSIQEDMEWEPLFEGQRRKAAALQADIQRVDREIDGLVYGLYGLTVEEVGIIEGSS